MIGTGHSLPPINGKDGLTVTTTLQSRFLREADMILNLAQVSRGIIEAWTPIEVGSCDGPCP